jgi:hypothetical protein
LSGLFLVEEASDQIQIELTVSTAGKAALVFEDHDSVPVFTLGVNSVSTSFYVQDNSSNQLLLINSSTKAVNTFNNTLDDGNGNAVIQGSLFSLANTLDDGSGNMAITGSLTIGGTIQDSSHYIYNSGTFYGGFNGLQGAALVDNGSGSWTVTGNMIMSGTITGCTSMQTVKGMSINGSSVIANGVIGSVVIPFNCTLTKWAVVSTDGTSGTITFDVQQSTFGSAIYTNTTANSIVGSGSGGVYPGLTSQTTNSSSTLTHWTTSLTGGEYLVFVVNNTPSSVKNVRIELTLTPR